MESPLENTKVHPPKALPAVKIWGMPDAIDDLEVDEPVSGTPVGLDAPAGEEDADGAVL